MIPLAASAILFLALRSSALGGLSAGGGDADQRLLALSHLPVLLADGLRALLSMHPVGYRELALEYVRLGWPWAMGSVLLLAPLIRDPGGRARGQDGEQACDYFGQGGDWGVSGGGGGAGGTIRLQADSVLGGELLATGGGGGSICGHASYYSASGGVGRITVTANDWSGNAEPQAASPAGADGEACGGEPRRVGEDQFGGVRLFEFEEVAGPGCVTRTGSCPEGVLVREHFRDRGFVFADETKNVYNGYARSPGFSICNGPHSGWGNRPSEFRIVLPGTDLPAVVARLGFYTGGTGACNPMRVEFFDVDGNRIGDFDDVPCGTGRVPSRWHGFMGMGNIHRVRISGDGYAYDDLRLPAPVLAGDMRACPEE